LGSSPERKALRDATGPALPVVELRLERAHSPEGCDGCVPIGTQRLRLERPPGSKVVLCLHSTGHHSVLTATPDPNQKPVLLFINRPN
jgi:hypothetical protein